MSAECPDSEWTSKRTLVPIQRAVALVISRPIICGVDQTSAGLQQAQNLIAAKRYDDALRILGRIPEDAEARLLSSVAYFFKDEPRPALDEVERSIALSPDAPEPYAFR